MENPRLTIIRYLFRVRWKRENAAFSPRVGDIPSSFVEVELHRHSLISSVAELSQSAPPEIIRLRRFPRWVKDIARETEDWPGFI
jgi:hypothetical protein